MAFAFPFLLCRCCRQCRSTRHRAFSTTLCSWSPAENSSYYDLLGIKPDATLEEIKEAFFRKSKQLHPDSNLGNPGLHSEFVKLNEAYRVLRKEGSRRHYDSLRRVRAAWPATGSPTRSPFDAAAAADFGTRSKSEPNENVRYWQQFHAAPPDSHSGPEAERELRQNQKLLGYCLLIMLGSLAVHYVGFRKLEEFHNSFMDEKDRAITQIYNESKERARSIGLQKQQELLRQKNAEFSQRYGLRHRHLPGSAGASDSAKDPAPPSSPAQ